MLISSLPPDLMTPVRVNGQVACRLMLDLTAYLVGPTEQELEYLISLYEHLCPKDRLVKYKIAELQYWAPVAQPHLTASGRAAAAAGVARPYLEPVRKRIRAGRAFEIQYWDGRSIDDVKGSWSFSCRRVHLQASGHHSFVRVLIPLQSDPGILTALAGALAKHVALYSGHAGLTFAYDPWLKEAAFNHIYAQARRYWGIDIEDLNATLLQMKKGIKGVSWLTLLGQAYMADSRIQSALAALGNRTDVVVERRAMATLLLAGAQPVAGDQHRPDNTLAPYIAIAQALQPLMVSTHPDFSGEKFVRNGNTTGWLNRFVDPGGWR